MVNKQIGQYAKNNKTEDLLSCLKPPLNARLSHTRYTHFYLFKLPYFVVICYKISACNLTNTVAEEVRFIHFQYTKYIKKKLQMYLWSQRMTISMS